MSRNSISSHRHFLQKSGLERCERWNPNWIKQAAKTAQKILRKHTLDKMCKHDVNMLGIEDVAT